MSCAWKVLLQEMGSCCANVDPARLREVPRKADAKLRKADRRRASADAQSRQHFSDFLCPLPRCRQRPTTRIPRVEQAARGRPARPCRLVQSARTCRITFTVPVSPRMACLLILNGFSRVARNVQALLRWYSDLPGSHRMNTITKIATACSALLITSAALAQTAPPLGTPVGNGLGVTVGGLLGLPVGTQTADRRRRPAGRHCDRPGDRHLDRAPQERTVSDPCARTGPAASGATSLPRVRAGELQGLTG